MSRKEKFLDDSLIIQKRILNLKKLTRDMVKHSDEFIDDERVEKNIETIIQEAYKLKAFYSQRGSTKNAA